MSKVVSKARYLGQGGEVDGWTAADRVDGRGAWWQAQLNQSIAGPLPGVRACKKTPLLLLRLRQPTTTLPVASHLSLLQQQHTAAQPCRTPKPPPANPTTLALAPLTSRLAQADASLARQKTASHPKSLFPLFLPQYERHSCLPRSAPSSRPP